MPTRPALAATMTPDALNVAAATAWGQAAAWRRTSPEDRAALLAWWADEATRLLRDARQYRAHRMAGAAATAVRLARTALRVVRHYGTTPAGATPTTGAALAA